MKFIKNIDKYNKNILLNLVIFILLIIIFLLILYYMLKEKESYDNRIPLLKFVNKNNKTQIISTYPINNYPDSFKIKRKNLTELIIPIEYNINIEKFTTEKEESENKGPRGEPGYKGPPGENAEPCSQGAVGPEGPPGINGVDCIPCEDGPSGEKGEDGIGIESSSYNSVTGKLQFNYTNGETLLTENIKGDKGDKGDPCGVGPQGPQGPPGSAPGSLYRNWNTMYLPYINIQQIALADPWIYTLGNNCFIIAAIHRHDYQPAMFYRLNGDYRKFGYPWHTMTSSKDGGDNSGIIMIAERDGGSIKFKLEDSKMYGSMTVISFWF